MVSSVTDTTRALSHRFKQSRFLDVEAELSSDTDFEDDEVDDESESQTANDDGELLRSFFVPNRLNSPQIL
jgi:hypothetical protein